MPVNVVWRQNLSAETLTTLLVEPLTQSDDKIDYVNDNTSRAVNVVCADKFYRQTALTAQHTHGSRFVIFVVVDTKPFTHILHTIASLLAKLPEVIWVNVEH